MGAGSSNGVVGANSDLNEPNCSSKTIVEEETTTNESKPKANGLLSGFKFGRLKEEGEVDKAREKVVMKLDKSIVIGNPVLVDKSSMDLDKTTVVENKSVTNNNNNLLESRTMAVDSVDKVERLNMEKLSIAENG